jgi:hypothetical protein
MVATNTTETGWLLAVCNKICFTKMHSLVLLYTIIYCTGMELVKHVSHFICFSCTHTHTSGMSEVLIVYFPSTGIKKLL